jgi:hypothetical protein
MDIAEAFTAAASIVAADMATEEDTAAAEGSIAVAEDVASVDIIPT